VPGRHHPATIAIALVVLVSPVATARAGAAAVPGPVTPSGYRPPVVAPVTDPFRAPASTYGAGNRGIEYATRPGVPVGAIGAGTVVFAGPVARRLSVTVLHRDGLRSSYSYLATITVIVGSSVVAGQTIGTAGPRLHLGVRRGDRYLDPASLFRRGRPRLVPSIPSGERPTAARGSSVRERRR
jgi:murein DD-endopeptidase MepM/ murein hydrolase activator NlpD